MMRSRFGFGSVPDRADRHPAIRPRKRESVGSIKLVTDVPGPNSLALVQRRAAAGSAGMPISAVTTSDEQIDEALVVLDEAFAAAAGARSVA